MSPATVKREVGSANNEFFEGMAPLIFTDARFDAAAIEDAAESEHEAEAEALLTLAQTGLLEGSVSREQAARLIGLARVHLAIAQQHDDCQSALVREIAALIAEARGWLRKLGRRLNGWHELLHRMWPGGPAAERKVA